MLLEERRHKHEATLEHMHDRVKRDVKARDEEAAALEEAVAMEEARGAKLQELKNLLEGQIRSSRILLML